MHILKPPNRERPSVRANEAAMKRVVAAFFLARRAEIVRPLVQAYKGTGKANNMDAQLVEVDRLLALLDLGLFADLPEKTVPVLEAAGLDSSKHALAALKIDDPDMFDLVNRRVVSWAQARAAEMVGKKWVNERLVDNPNAEWRIDEGTREKIRGQVVQALEEGWSKQRLSYELEQGSAFSPARSDLIAQTEINRAEMEGNTLSWGEVDAVTGKVWMYSNEADVCDACLVNARQKVIGYNEEFISGDYHPPAHPNCRCDMAPVLE